MARSLTATNAGVLGSPLSALPVVLLLLRLACAQLVPVQLAVIEGLRPILGWRGLYEVRSGPVERARGAAAGGVSHYVP